MKSKPCNQAAMQVLERIPPALPPRPEDLIEYVPMRRKEWCPWEDSKFRAPHQAVSKVTFDRVAYPRFAVIFGLFSVTYLIFLYCVRGLALSQSPTRTAAKPSPQSRGLYTRRGHLASPPPNHNGAADSRSSATVMNFFCLPRETSSTAICRRANFFLDSAAERAREPRSMPRIVLARQTKLQKDQTEEPRDSPPPLLPPLALLTIY